VWVEQLAAKIGFAPPTPDFPHVSNPAFPYGTNFAVAGAQTGSALGDMGFQVSTFLSENPAPLLPNSIYVLFGGANNLYTAADPVAASTVALGNIEAEIAALYGAGARSFLFPNLPDLGKTPPGAAGQNAAALKHSFAQFRTQLGGLNQRRTRSRHRHHRGGPLLYLPAAFGLANVNHAGAGASREPGPVSLLGWLTPHHRGARHHRQRGFRCH